VGFAERAKVLPAQAEVERQLGGGAEIVLGEETEAFVASCSLGVAGVGQDKNVADVKVGQRIDYRVRIQPVGVDGKCACPAAR